MNGRLAYTFPAAFAVLALLATTDFASAEPYIAVRTGLKCSACHVNRTGGGGRNDFGSLWAQTSLPIKSQPVRNRRLNDWASIGFDFRGVGSFLTERAAPETPRSQIEISEAQVQLEARFLADVLALYIDQTIGPGRAFTREAFGLVEWEGDVRGYAKAGKFLLPYGWRLWDDEALIRTQTGFQYSTPDIGLEVGIEPGPLSWSVAVTNGTTAGPENNSGKMVTSSAAVVTRRFRIGASASHNSLEDAKTNIFGAFAGATVGPITVLGESDFVFDSFDDAPDRDQLVAYVEGNYLVRQGVNLTISHGFHDPEASIRDEPSNVPEDERTRTRAGVELFPTSFVQVSGYFTRFDEAGDEADQSRVSLEVHLHF